MVGFTVLAEKIGFTEGPVWTSTGRLLVTSMSRGLVYVLGLSPGEPVAAFETGGGPNGLAEGPDGQVWVAQNGGATIASRSPRPVRPGLQTIDSGGTVRDVLAGDFAAPNDLVVGPDGRVWFTDPASDGSRSRVRAYDPDSGEVQVVLSDVDFPNGLAFGPDPADLYVADSDGDQILRYRLDGFVPGRRAVFAESPGGPDGIAFDAEGHLYVAAFEADEVQVFDRAGTLVRRLPTGPGSRPTNLCFAGPDRATLVVTLAKGGRVVAFDEVFAGADPSPWLVRP